MFLTSHALASPAQTRVAGRVAQLVRALVSHTRGPGFESLRDHSPTWPASGGHPSALPGKHKRPLRMMSFLQLRFLVAAAAICVAGQEGLAQQPRPTPEQARALLQARPELILQLR